MGAGYAFIGISNKKEKAAATYPPLFVFSTLGGPRRIFMLCLAVGLAQRPTGNSAAVVRACWFVIKKSLSLGWLLMCVAG